MLSLVQFAVYILSVQLGLGVLVKPYAVNQYTADIGPPTQSSLLTDDDGEDCYLTTTNVHVVG